MGRGFGTLSVAEVLALAIDVERRNAERYETLARIFETRSNELFVLMKELADEELDHMDRLEAIWSQRFGETSKPDVHATEVDFQIERVGPDPFDFNGQKFIGVDEAIAIANCAERDARDFYVIAARNTLDPELAALYTELSKLESEHLLQVTVEPGFEL